MSCCDNAVFILSLGLGKDDILGSKWFCCHKDNSSLFKYNFWGAGNCPDVASERSSFLSLTAGKLLCISLKVSSGLLLAVIERRTSLTRAAIAPSCHPTATPLLDPDIKVSSYMSSEQGGVDERWWWGSTFSLPATQIWQLGQCPQASNCDALPVILAFVFQVKGWVVELSLIHYMKLLVTFKIKHADKQFT